MLVYQILRTDELVVDYKVTNIEDVTGDFVTYDELVEKQNHKLNHHISFRIHDSVGGVVSAPNYDRLQVFIDSIISCYNNKPKNVQSGKLSECDLAIYKMLEDHFTVKGQVDSYLRETYQLRIVGKRVRSYQHKAPPIPYNCIKRNIVMRIALILSNRYDTSFNFQCKAEGDNFKGICQLAKVHKITLKEVMDLKGGWGIEYDAGWMKNEDGNKEKIITYIKEKLDFC